MTSKILRQCGIYCIRNLINGKRYVGSSNDLRRRLTGHKYKLRKNAHINPALQHAWNKYGEASFVFEVIQTVSDFSMLEAAEQKLIDEFGCVVPRGYNLRREASSNFGLRHTEEAKLKISKAGKGRKLSPEHCRIIGDSHRGTHHTEATKSQISKALQGRKMKFSDPVGRGLKISKSRTGYVMPERTKKKLSKMFKGKSMLTNDTKTNIRFLYEFGKNRGEIAFITGIHRQTVGRIISGKTT